jgi:hypothetical protein
LLDEVQVIRRGRNERQLVAHAVDHRSCITPRREGSHSDWLCFRGAGQDGGPNSGDFTSVEFLDSTAVQGLVNLARLERGQPIGG